MNVIGTMPMSTLANFGGMSLDHDALDQATTAWAERTGQARPTQQAALSHA